MKTSKSLFASLFVAAAVLVLAPVADVAVALAQVPPPPALPGAPDQSPLWGAGIAAIAALIFGIWRLRSNRK